MTIMGYLLGVAVALVAGYHIGRLRAQRDESDVVRRARRIVQRWDRPL